jgi:hypothetical protein
MSQEITLYDKIQDPTSDAIKLGEYLGKSGLFGCTKVEQGVVFAMTCFFERKSPLDMIRTYHVTQDGKLIKKALAQLAEFRNKGGKHKWLNSGDTPAQKREDWKATGEFIFEGVTYKVEFSMADADRQELVRPKGNWIKTPGNMLRARVITNALGMLCPEIVAGSADAPEEEDPEVKNISPLLPKEQATVTTDRPDKKKAAVVNAPIDVQATVKQDDSNPDLKPAQTAAAAPPADAKPFKAEADAAGKLTLSTVQALQAAIGEDNAAMADKWMMQKDWIKTSGDLFNLTVKRAQMILDNPPKALATMKAQVVAK